MKKILMAVFAILIMATAADSGTLDLSRRGIWMENGLCLGCDGIQFYRKTSTTPAAPSTFIYQNTGGITYLNTGGITYEDY